MSTEIMLKSKPNMAADKFLGKPVNCYYCPSCTTHAYHHQTVMGDKIVVRTILLDQGKSLKAGAEIFGKDRLPWEKEVAQTFEGLPPS
jgi:hypothetical protein